MVLRSACQEPHRPQLSYSSARNWMNDPNGLVYHDGEYHLFYQYNPNGNEWGDISWGHAVSADLVHWSELPVALPAEKDALGGITQYMFSGSAVVDSANTSALGLPGLAPMVAIYTSVYPNAMTLANGRRVRQGQQSQSLAYSLDRGRSWLPYAGNPVLEGPPDAYRDDYQEFRDPKVFWYAPEEKWVMVVVLAHRHKALLYASKDLRDWAFMSEFGPAGATGGVWECPDLFALPLDDDPANTHWVLVINLNPGGPAGGSGAQYFIGQFDGTRFQASDDGQAQWLDSGPDFYAAVTWNDAPGQRRLMIGWMSNWLYARQVPTAPWRGGQTIVRELALRTVDGRVCLVQQPLAGLEGLRQELLYAVETLPVTPGPGTLTQIRTGGGPADIELLLDPGTALQAGVQVHIGENGDRTVVGYDRLRGQVYIDRSAAGDSSFSPEFAARHAAPVALDDGAISLRILLDTASVTVFAGPLGTALTCQVFPRAGSDAIALFAQGGQASARRLKIWSLASILPTPVANLA